MATNEVTKKDLEQLKEDILSEIRALINPDTSKLPHWLKSNDVPEILKISAGTLQALRVKGILKYTKVGGSFYYKRADIRKLLEGK